MTRRARFEWPRACTVVFALFLFLSVTASEGVQAANGSVTYSYDALGRIVLASYDTGVCISYTYDAVGNRLSESIIVPSSSGTGIWGCFNWNNAKWGS
jgi:hypothetical protein